MTVTIALCCCRWKAMRNYIARITSSLFNTYLQEKGASGSVLLLLYIL